MKRTIKTIYNAGIVVLFLILGFIVGNVAFAEVIQVPGTINIPNVGNITVTVTYNDDYLADPPQIWRLDFNETVYNYLKSQDTSFLYNTTNDFTSLYLDTVYVNNGNIEDSVNTLGDNVRFSVNGQELFYIQNNDPVIYSINNYLSDTGFGSFLGSTTPMQLVGSVSSGVVDTGSSIWPVIGFAGVPIGFTIVGYTLWFIRRSIF